MGWNPADVNRPQVLIVSTQGGLREPTAVRSRWDFTPATGRSACWCRAAAETLREAGVVPFAAYCSDPCDGRTQGTAGMFDSLPYRNDAAIMMRRLIRSLPRRAGVDRHRHLRQGAAGDDAGAGGLRPPARHRRARRRHAAGDRRRGRRQGPVDRRALRARADHGGRRGDDGMPGLRHAGRRLPVPRDGGDVAGGGRSARHDAAAQRALPRPASRSGSTWPAARPSRSCGSSSSGSRCRRS